MDNTNLRVWMAENGYTNASLADKMNYSYEYIYKLATGSAVVSEGFKWRFAQHFGWDVANAVFDEAQPAHA